MIYLDSAATTPLDPEVQASMKDAEHYFANSNSQHSCGHEVNQLHKKAINSIAKKLGVLPEQLIITHGGSDSNQKIINEIKKQFPITQLWCSNIEHSSVVDEILLEQQFEPFSYKEIKKDAKFIALMKVNNETGTIFNINTLKKDFPNAHIHCDFVQATGKHFFNPKECDSASFSAHKIYGPKGIGILYIKNPENFHKLINTHHTQNTQLIVGMAKAFELIGEKDSSNNKIKQQQLNLEDFFTNEFPDSKIIHKNKERTHGIISVAFPNIRGSELMNILSEKEEICLSTGSACLSDILKPTRVIQEFEKDTKYQYPIRIGLHKFLSDEQINEFCEVLEYYVKEKK